jgi:hypothetical protein
MNWCELINGMPDWAWTLIALAVAVVVMMVPFLCASCTHDPFPEEETEFEYVAVFDTSDSFEDDFAEVAFNHFVKLRGQIMRDAMGTNSLILLAQIGEGEALLFEGSPQAFNERWPTKEAFQAELQSLAGGSSPVFISCSETIERLVSRHEQNPGLQSMVVVYSDMADNHGGEERFMDALEDLGQFNTAVGMYRVENEEYWEQVLDDAGIEHRAVHDSLRQDPPLPQL